MTKLWSGGNSIVEKILIDPSIFVRGELIKNLLYKNKVIYINLISIFSRLLIYENRFDFRVKNYRNEQRDP